MTSCTYTVNLTVLKVGMQIVGLVCILATVSSLVDSEGRCVITYLLGEICLPIPGRYDVAATLSTFVK